MTRSPENPASSKNIPPEQLFLETKYDKLLEISNSKDAFGITFMSDDKLLVLSRYQTAHIYSTLSGSLIKSLDLERTVDREILSAKSNKTGEVVFVGRIEGGFSLVLWNFENGSIKKIEQKLKPNDRERPVMDIDQDGEILVGVERKLYVYNQEGEPESEFSYKDSPIVAVTVNPDASLIATNHSRGELNIRAKGGILRRYTLYDPTKDIPRSALAWYNNDVIMVGFANRVFFIDINSRPNKRDWKESSLVLEGIPRIILSLPNGNIAFVLDHPKLPFKEYVLIYDPKRNISVQEIHTNHGKIIAMDVDNRGRIAIGGLRDNVSIWGSLDKAYQQKK